MFFNVFFGKKVVFKNFKIGDPFRNFSTYFLHYYYFVLVDVAVYYSLESFAEHFHVFALDDCGENVDQA